MANGLCLYFTLRPRGSSRKKSGTIIINAEFSIFFFNLSKFLIKFIKLNNQYFSSKLERIKKKITEFLAIFSNILRQVYVVYENFS